MSSVSGVDHPGDARVLAALDFDRDGFTDFALASGNSPKLMLYHNRVGEFAGMADRTCVGIRLVGGNKTPNASRRWSARTPIGARVILQAGNQNIHRELRCGEGMGAQNGSAIVIGVGSADSIENLRVRWPSGRITEVPVAKPGVMVTVYENPEDGPEGRAFVVEPYRGSDSKMNATAAVAQRAYGPAHARVQASNATLRVYSSMATWCPSCRRELPTFAQLRRSFDPEHVAFYGVPSDPAESRDVLTAYATNHEPAYDLLVDLAAKDVEEFMRLALEETRVEVRPSTIVTDAKGRVLLRKKGPPTASELNALLMELEAPQPKGSSSSGR